MNDLRITKSDACESAGNNPVLSFGTARLKRRQFIGTAMAALTIAPVIYASVWEPKWLATRRVTIPGTTPRQRLVHFTDLHYKGDRRYLTRVVDRINSVHPQLVCFTGDIVEEAEYLPEALELMQRIDAPLYGVPGNHDYWAKVDFAVVAQTFSKTGGQWLMDESVLTADQRINVIGVTCSKPPLVHPVPGVKNVLLFHYPAWVQKLSQVRFDLMLAGHSHGGQVRLPFYGPLLVPFGVNDFDLGLYQTAVGPLYVNPGIGYFYLNVRICCRPEITVLEV